MAKEKGVIIEADLELIEILDIIEGKVKKAAWDGVDKISKRTLTKILARKVKSSKIL